MNSRIYWEVWSLFITYMSDSAPFGMISHPVPSGDNNLLALTVMNEFTLIERVQTERRGELKFCSIYVKWKLQMW